MDKNQSFKYSFRPLWGVEESPAPTFDISPGLLNATRVIVLSATTPDLNRMGEIITSSHVLSMNIFN